MKNYNDKVKRYDFNLKPVKEIFSNKNREDSVFTRNSNLIFSFSTYFVVTHRKNMKLNIFH